MGLLADCGARTENCISQKSVPVARSLSNQHEVYRRLPNRGNAGFLEGLDSSHEIVIRQALETKIRQASNTSLEGSYPLCNRRDILCLSIKANLLEVDISKLLVLSGDKAMRSLCMLAVMLISAICIATSAFAAESNTPELPQNVEQWLNFQPVSVQNLKGKGVVLYFFEEGCPRCKARWPELLQTAKQYEGKPVMFIAVNSGSPAQAVSSYAREVGVSWPVIVDSDRSLEKQFDITEVSLQNIWQTVIVTPGGEVRKMGGDFGAAAAAAATGAAWKTDPASIPADLKGAWLAIELGNYGQAGAAVKKSLTSSKPDVKAAAEKLNEGVQKAIETEAASAEQLNKQDKHWQAYKIYQQIGRRYQGFPIPDSITQAAVALSKDPAIMAEQKAAKELDMARKTGNKGSAASVRRAKAMLEKLIASSPDTEAASEAKLILLKLPSE